MVLHFGSSPARGSLALLSPSGLCRRLSWLPAEGTGRETAAAPPGRERPGLRRKALPTEGTAMSTLRGCCCELMCPRQVPSAALLRGTRPLRPCCVLFTERTGRKGPARGRGALADPSRGGSSSAQGRGGGGTPSLTYSWKSALSPRIAEVRAAQINANLLTANKPIKWKLIKEIYFKETSGDVFLCRHVA